MDTTNKEEFLQKKYSGYKFCIRISCIMTVLFFFLQMSMTINIEFRDTANGSLQVYYLNSRKPDISLMEYDTNEAWKNIYQGDTSLSFENIPLLTDSLRLDIDGTDRISISSVTVSLGKLCLKEYNATDLFSSIVDSSNVNFSQSDGSLDCRILSENAFIQLENHVYMAGCYWVLIIVFLLGISLMIYSGLLYCNSRLIEQYDEEILLFTIPLFNYILMESLNQNYWYIDFKYRFLNYMILLLIYHIIFQLTFRSSLSILICNLCCFGFSIVNYYLVLFRGRPFLPTDIYGAGTAFQVLRSYSFPLPGLGIFFFICCLAWHSFLKKAQQKPKHFSIKSWLTVPLLLLIGSIVFHTDCYVTLPVAYWDSDILYYYKLHGMVATFIKYAQNLHISVPDNYSSIFNEYLDEINLTDEAEQKLSAVQPINIIMIMNESFSDLRVLGAPYSENVLPFYTDLTENTIKGNLYVSVRGGGTCNTEFESLTGNSLIFFPPGTMPFQTYLRRSTSSIATYLASQGFSVYALHLEDAQNWNRKHAYPLLGLGNFYSLQDFTDVETVRKYATDEANYKQIIEWYENKKTDKFFCFNVTIQNHGGYDKLYDLKKTVDLSNYGNYPDAEVFLSLMQKSDQAFEKLIQYFSQVEEPTMVIMYGDHQPTLSSQTEEWLSSGSAYSDIDGSLNRYITPFVIWTNYDIEENYIDKISANYLSSLILKTANFSLPAYNRFLLSLYEKYPVITTQGVIDYEGNCYSNFQALINEVPELQLYQKLQYNNLFDEKRFKNYYD